MSAPQPEQSLLDLNGRQVHVIDEIAAAGYDEHDPLSIEHASLRTLARPLDQRRDVRRLQRARPADARQEADLAALEQIQRYPHGGLPALLDAIAEYVGVETEQIVLGAGADDLVFGTRDGQPLDRKNLFNRVLKPAARRAGVPWAGFHTLRHTCATMLFRSGLNAKQVQVWLGHHSPAFTLAVYVHLLPDDLPEPVDPSFVAALQGGNKVGTREAEIGRNPLVAEVAV